MISEGDASGKGVGTGGPRASYTPLVDFLSTAVCEELLPAQWGGVGMWTPWGGVLALWLMCCVTLSRPSPSLGLSFRS